jgi:hypothetical protein
MADGELTQAQESRDPTIRPITPRVRLFSGPSTTPRIGAVATAPVGSGERQHAGELRRRNVAVERAGERRGGDELARDRTVGYAIDADFTDSV